MADLPDKNIKTAIISMFKMFFSLKEIVNVMRGKKRNFFFFKESVGVYRDK